MSLHPRARAASPPIRPAASASRNSPWPLFAKPGTGPIRGTGTPPTPAGGGTGGTGGSGTAPPLPGLTAKPRAFHGTAEVNAAAAKVRLTELADEIIAFLVSEPTATFKVTVEIDADFPNGAPDHIKRAVSKNATGLNLKNKDWE